MNVRIPYQLRSVYQFFKDTRGAVSIEMVIWLPVFTLLLGVVADAALIFSKQAQVLRIVQDANRATSIGRLVTSAETEAFIANRISQISPNALIVTTIQAGIISSTVTMPASDLTATSLVAAFSSIDVSVSSQHLSEA